jgi:hypothetical protein
VTTSLTNPTAVSAKSRLDDHGKENAEFVGVATEDGNAKKRKGDPQKPKTKRAKKDNSKPVDVHTAQEDDAPEENNAAETAATRSGRKSNLPGHLKDAGYAPPKRNMRKKND